MTDILLGLASLGLVTLIGYLALLTLDQHRLLGSVERLALGYGAGVGLLVWEMLVFQALGFSFGVPALLGSLLGISALVFLVVMPRRSRDRSPEAIPRLAAAHLQPLEWFFVAALVLEASSVFFRASFRPMEAYDAVSNWGLKGKAIWLAGNIPTSFLQNPNYEVFHPDYPLLVPLLESYVYRFAGGLREGSAKLMFPLFLAGCAVTLFAALRRTGQTRRSCLLFSFLLISIPYFSEHATNGYADVILGFYFCAGTLYLYFWQITGETLFFVLSTLFAGFAALTKNEGLLLVGIYLIWITALLLWRTDVPFRNRIATLGISCCLLAALLMPWYLFKASLGLRNDVINSEAIKAGLKWSGISRLGPILYHFQTQVFGPKNWNLVWMLFAAAVCLRQKVLLRTPAVSVLLATVAVLIAYVGVYLITPYSVAPFDVTWHLRTSASRLLLHVLPQVVFLIGLAFGEVEDRDLDV